MKKRRIKEKIEKKKIEDVEKIIEIENKESLNSWDFNENIISKKKKAFCYDSDIIACTLSR